MPPPRKHHIQSIVILRRLLPTFDRFLPGDVAIDPRFLGESQYALADDVALDLVGAAGDAVAGRSKHMLVLIERAPLARVGGQSGAEHLGHHVGHLVHADHPEQFAGGALRAGGLTGS